MPEHIVTEQGKRDMETSRKVSPSTKRAKPHQPTFGTSSQFKGIQRGVPGDVRK